MGSAIKTVALIAGTGVLAVTLSFAEARTNGAENCYDCGFEVGG
jgi:hypothetical protein